MPFDPLLTITFVALVVGGVPVKGLRVPITPDYDNVSLIYGETYPSWDPPASWPDSYEYFTDASEAKLFVAAGACPTSASGTVLYRIRDSWGATISSHDHNDLEYWQTRYEGLGYSGNVCQVHIDLVMF